MLMVADGPARIVGNSIVICVVMGTVTILGYSVLPVCIASTHALHMVKKGSVCQLCTLPMFVWVSDQTSRLTAAI